MYTALGVILLAMFVILSLRLIVTVSARGLIYIFYPPVFLALFYLLFFLLPSAVMLFSADFIDYRYRSYGYELQTWFITQVFAFVFVAVTYLVCKLASPYELFQQRAREAIVNLQIDLPVLGKLFYGFIFIALPLLSFIFMFTLFGGDNYQEYMIDRTQSRKGLGYFLMPSAWLSLTLTAYFLKDVVIKPKLSSFLLFSAFLLGYVLIQLYFGSKSRGLIVVAFCILTFTLYRSIINRISIMSLGISFLLVLSISAIGLRFGDIRQSIVADKALEEIDSRLSYQKIFVKFNSFGAIENTLWLVEELDLNRIKGGDTFTAVLAAPVPRAIWENKPLGGGPALRNLIYPGSYDIIDGKNLTSYSPGIIAEAYMNFYWLGAPLIGLIWGLVLAFFARTMGYVRTIIGLTTWTVCLYIISQILTAEVLASISKMGQYALPLVLVAVFLRLFPGRQDTQSAQSAFLSPRTQPISYSTRPNQT